VPERRPRSPLPREDERLARQIQDVYGPTRWKWGEWTGLPEPPPPKAPRPRASAASVVMRTVFVSAIALVVWYGTVGDREALARTLMVPLKAIGIAQTTPSPTATAEYLLAQRTLQVGDAYPPSDSMVLKLKDLLDQLAPKCTEDRFALAGAVIAARDGLVARGVDRSALWILTQANGLLSDQPQPQSRARCADVIGRVALSTAS